MSIRTILAGGLICALALSAVPTAYAGSLDPYGELWDRIDGSTATIPLMQAVRTHFGIDRNVRHSTTPDAYEALCAYEADLILVTPPCDEDRAIAREAGVELEAVPVALEALVFLNNAENPVTDLSQDALRAIYTGQITNWREVGGADQPIFPYQRPDRSGSQTLFLQCLMRGIPPMIPTKELVLDSMSRLIDQVAEYDNAPNALGYSVYYYATNMYMGPAIRVLSVDGVAPDARSIASGEYPFTDAYYAVLRADTPADHPARQLLAWLLSEEGQQMAAGAGYVPMGGLAKGAGAQ